MNDDNWKEEFKQWKPDLKPFQIKLIDQGPKSQNQAFMLNDMWCEWRKIAVKRKIHEIAGKAMAIDDPWSEAEPYG